MQTLISYNQITHNLNPIQALRRLTKHTYITISYMILPIFFALSGYGSAYASGFTCDSNPSVTTDLTGINPSRITLGNHGCLVVSNAGIIEGKGFNSVAPPHGPNQNEWVGVGRANDHTQFVKVTNYGSIFSGGSTTDGRNTYGIYVPGTSLELENNNTIGDDTTTTHGVEGGVSKITNGSSSNSDATIRGSTNAIKIASGDGSGTNSEVINYGKIVGDVFITSGSGKGKLTTYGSGTFRSSSSITGDVSSGSAPLEMFIHGGSISGEVTINQNKDNNLAVDGLVRVIGQGAVFPSFSSNTKKTLAELKITSSNDHATGSSDIIFKNTGNEVKLTSGKLDGDIKFLDSNGANAKGTVTIVDGNMTGSISMAGSMAGSTMDSGYVVLDGTDCDQMLTNGCQGPRVPTFSNTTTNTEIELKTESYFGVDGDKDIVFKNTGNVVKLTYGKLNGNIKFRNSDDTANAAGTVNVGDGSTKGTLASGKSIFMDGGTINIKTANATVPVINSSTINSTVDIQQNASSNIQFQNTGNIATLTSGVLDGDIKFLNNTDNTANAAGTVNVAAGTLAATKSIHMSGGIINLNTGATAVPAVDSGSSNNTLNINNNLTLDVTNTRANEAVTKPISTVGLVSGALSGDIKFQDGSSNNLSGTVDVSGGTLAANKYIYMSGGTINLNTSATAVPAVADTSSNNTLNFNLGSGNTLTTDSVHVRTDNTTTGKISTVGLVSGTLGGDIKFQDSSNNNLSGTVDVSGGTLAANNSIHMSGGTINLNTGATAVPAVGSGSSNNTLNINNDLTLDVTNTRANEAATKPISTVGLVSGTLGGDIKFIDGTNNLSGTVDVSGGTLGAGKSIHMNGGTVNLTADGATVPAINSSTTDTTIDIQLSSGTTAASNIQFQNTGNIATLTSGELNGNIKFLDNTDNTANAAGTVNVGDGTTSGTLATGKSIFMDGGTINIKTADATVPVINSSTINSTVDIQQNATSDIKFLNTGNVATLTTGTLTGDIKFRNSGDTANAAGTVNVGDGTTSGTLANGKSIFMDGGTINIKTANATVPAVNSNSSDNTLNFDLGSGNTHTTDSVNQRANEAATKLISTVGLVSGTLDGDIKFQDGSSNNLSGTVDVSGGTLAANNSIHMSGGIINLNTGATAVPSVNSGSSNNTLNFNLGSGNTLTTDSVNTRASESDAKPISTVGLVSGALNGDIKFQDSSNNNLSGTVDVSGGTLGAGKSIHMSGGTINLNTGATAVPAVGSGSSNNTLNINNDLTLDVTNTRASESATKPISTVGLVSGTLGGDIKFIDGTNNLSGTVDVSGGTLGAGKSIHMNGGTVNLTADGATVPAINSSTTDTTIDIQLSSGTTAASNIQFQNTGNIATLTSGVLDGDIKFLNNTDNTANAAGTVNVGDGTTSGTLAANKSIFMDGGTINIKTASATVPVINSSTINSTVNIQQNATSDIKFLNTGNVATLTTGTLTGDIKFRNSGDTANAAGTVNVGDGTTSGTLANGKSIFMDGGTINIKTANATVPAVNSNSSDNTLNFDLGSGNTHTTDSVHVRTDNTTTGKISTVGLVSGALNGNIKFTDGTNNLSGTVDVSGGTLAANKSIHMSGGIINLNTGATAVPSVNSGSSNNTLNFDLGSSNTLTTDSVNTRASESDAKPISTVGLVSGTLGGDIKFQDSSNNNLSGTVDVSGGTLAANNSIHMNGGTVNLTADGATVPAINSSTTNTTIDIQVGAGNSTAASNIQFENTDNTATLTTGTLTGDIKFRNSGDTANAAGTVNVGDGTTSGTLATGKSIFMDGGTINIKTADATVPAINSSTINSTVNIQQNATSDIKFLNTGNVATLTTGTLTGDIKFRNSGDTANAAGTVDVSGGTLGAGKSIHMNGGTVNLTADGATVPAINSSTTDTTIDIQVGAGNSTAASNIQFENTGNTATLTSGTLDGDIKFLNNTDNTANAAGTVNVAAGTLAANKSIHMSGGIINLNTGATVPELASTSSDNTLNINNDLTLDVTNTRSNEGTTGKISTVGLVSGTLDGDIKFTDGTNNLSGTVNVSGGTLAANKSIHMNDGTVNLTANGATVPAISSSTTNSTVDIKVGNGKSTAASSDILFKNTGNVATLTSGTLNGDIKFRNSGDTANAAGTVNVTAGTIGSGKSISLNSGTVNLLGSSATLPAFHTSSHGNSLNINIGENQNMQVSRNTSVGRFSTTQDFHLASTFNTMILESGAINNNIITQNTGQTFQLHDEGYVNGDIICEEGQCTVELLEGGQGEHINGALISKSAGNTLKIDLDDGAAYFFNLTGSTVPWEVEDLDGKSFVLIPGNCVSFNVDCTATPSIVGAGLLEIRDEQLGDMVNHFVHKLNTTTPGWQQEVRYQNRNDSSDGHPQYTNKILALSKIRKLGTGKLLTQVQKDRIRIGSGLDVDETGLAVGYTMPLDGMNTHAFVGINNNKTLRDFHTTDPQIQHQEARFRSYLGGIGVGTGFQVPGHKSFANLGLTMAFEIVDAYSEGDEYDWERESFGLWLGEFGLKKETQAFKRTLNHHLFMFTHKMTGDDKQAFSYRGTSVEHEYISQSARAIGYSMATALSGKQNLHFEVTYSDDKLWGTSLRTSFAL